MIAEPDHFLAFNFDQFLCGIGMAAGNVVDTLQLSDGRSVNATLVTAGATPKKVNS